MKWSVQIIVTCGKYCTTHFLENICAFITISVTSLIFCLNCLLLKTGRWNSWCIISNVVVWLWGHLCEHKHHKNNNWVVIHFICLFIKINIYRATITRMTDILLSCSSHKSEEHHGLSAKQTTHLNEISLSRFEPKNIKKSKPVVLA